MYTSSKASSNAKAFSKGEVIARFNPEALSDMYVLIQGEVAVYKNYGMNNQELVTIVKAGDCFGEKAFFLGQSQAESFVALSAAVVMEITKRGFADFLKTSPDLVFTQFQKVYTELAASNEELAKHTHSSIRQTSTAKSLLLPEEHGEYELNLNNADESMLYINKTVCPLCGCSFDSLAYIATRLRAETTDDDLRTRYKNFEPMYYDIVTCPNCLFSAQNDIFDTASKRLADSINSEIGQYRLGMYINTGYERDTFSVFAGYYLAIKCAPLAFDNPQLITANLWLKLSRMYQDVNDEAMYLYSSQKAFEDYKYVYENINLSDKVLQQVAYLMGDLKMRSNDIDEARNLFFAAKTAKDASAVITRMADNRLEDIRALKQQPETV